MSIETRKSTIGDDLSIKSLKMKSLLANISSDFSFEIINSSFDISKEIITDLYDKENVFQRRFNYFKFPDYVKNMSRNYVDALFNTEIQLQIQKEIEKRRISRKASKVLRNSKMSDFFKKLSSSNKKRSRKKKNLFPQNNFSSIDDDFNIADDRDDFFDDEFKIDEEDCEEIQRNNPFEDSFQNDLSDIILKSRAQSKYKKIKFVDENQNEEIFYDERSHVRKEKRKKKKNKKRNKNKSGSDVSSLLSNDDKSNISSDSVKKRYYKENLDGKDKYAKDKDNEKKKRKRNIHKKSKENPNYKSPDYDLNTNLNNKAKEKEKVYKKSDKKDKKKDKNQKKKKSDCHDSEKVNKRSLSKSSFSSLSMQNSSESNSSKCSFSNKSDYSSNSSSYSSSESDSSLISNNCENSSSEMLNEEKKLIEEQIHEECEINSNDNTIIREKKLEKLKELNKKIENINDSLKKQKQKSLDNKFLNTLTKIKKIKNKNKNKKIKKRNKNSASKKQSEDKLSQSIKNRDKKHEKDKSPDKINNDVSDSEEPKTSKQLNKEAKKVNKIKQEVEKEKKKSKKKKEKDIKNENASQKSSIITDKSFDKKDARNKKSNFKTKEETAIVKRKKKKLDSESSFSSSSSGKEVKQNDRFSKTQNKDKISKLEKFKSKNSKNSNNHEVKERKSILKNKSKDPNKQEINKNTKTGNQSNNNLNNDNYNSQKRKKIDVNVKKSITSSNKNSERSVAKTKNLKNLKTIKSLESKLKYEEDHDKANSSSSLNISKNNQNVYEINNNNKNFSNKNKFNKSNKKPKHSNEDLKENSISSRYLKVIKKKSKHQHEEYLIPKKAKKKESVTDLYDGSSISKLKLLKRQITQQKKKDLLFQKSSFLAKQSTSNANIDPDFLCNVKNAKNFVSQNASLLTSSLKNQRTIALNKNTKKISDLNASLGNNSISSKSLVSPVAARIKNPIKIKEQVKYVFETIKNLKEEKDDFKEFLDEEKSKIQKNNLINLIIEEAKNSNLNESAHSHIHENNLDKKQIPYLKNKMRKISNDHVNLDRLKNIYIEEFKKVKSELENIRNSNRKSSIISEGKSSDLHLFINEEKTHDKNNIVSFTKKSSVTFNKQQMDAIQEVSKFDENLKIEKNRNKKTKGSSSNLDIGNLINKNDNISQGNSSVLNKNINSLRTKNSSRERNSNEINSEIRNKTQKEIINFDNNEKKFMSSENEKNNHFNINSNSRGNKLSSNNNILPALKINNLKEKQIKLIECKPDVITTYTAKTLNLETNIILKDKLNHLKNSQKINLEKLNLENKKDKIESNNLKIDNGNLNQINNNDKEIPIANQKKNSQAISNEEQKQKMLEMKEKLKIIDESKKQNFQNLIKLNIHKNQNRITFDFESSIDESQNVVDENAKQTESNFILRKNIINSKSGISKKINKQESMKLKQKEDFTKKYLSPIATNVDWIKNPHFLISASNVNNLNQIIPNKINENVFLALDPNSNNNTKKNFFINGKSENQIKFISNNNLKNEFNNHSNQNYLENKLNKGLNLESNKQLLIINNDNSKGFNYNQKLINPLIKETSKIKDLKGINYNSNHNGFSSFNNQNKISKSSFLGINSDGLSSKIHKLSEEKLPNIK